MRVSYTDGTEMEIYFGLEGGTSNVKILWVKKPNQPTIRIQPLDEEFFKE